MTTQDPTHPETSSDKTSPTSVAMPDPAEWLEAQKLRYSYLEYDTDRGEAPLLYVDTVEELLRAYAQDVLKAAAAQFGDEPEPWHAYEISSCLEEMAAKLTTKP